MFYIPLVYFLIIVSVNRCALCVCDRRTLILALFPDLPTDQFLLIYSMQKWKGKAWSILTCKWGLFLWYLVLNIHKAENYHLISMHVWHVICWLMTPPPICLDIYVIKWAIPSHHPVFVYCKWSKTGRWECLERKVLLLLQLSAECQPINPHNLNWSWKFTLCFYIVKTFT